MRKDDLTETDETFTLIYKTAAYSTTIPKSTPLSFVNECKNKRATHLVNRITFGQNAFFFFKRRLRENENSQHISGNLEAVVKAIPTFSIEGKASVDMQVIDNFRYTRIILQFCINDSIITTQTLILVIRWRLLVYL